MSEFNDTLERISMQLEANRREFASSAFVETPPA